MSYDAHEARSFDSFEQQLLAWDDYEGDSLKDFWDTTVVGTGTAVVIDAQTGGIVRLATSGATNDAVTLDWNDIRSLHVNKNICVEFRVKLTQTANTSVELQLRFDANNRVYFDYDSSVDGNWHAINTDGGAPTNVDTGIAADTDYHVFRIEASITAVRFYIDDTLEVTNTTNIPDDAGDYLQPALIILTLENAIKSMDADYYYARQER